MPKRWDGEFGRREGGKSRSLGVYRPDREAGERGCSGGETAKCACGKHYENGRENEAWCRGGEVDHETLGIDGDC